MVYKDLFHFFKNRRNFGEKTWVFWEVQYTDSSLSSHFEESNEGIPL